MALILLLALTLGLAACDESDPDYVGKYYEYADGVKNVNSWVELKADGTWVDNYEMTGTYTVNGTVITVTILGMPEEGTLENGVLTMLGTTYKKDTPSADGGGSVQVGKYYAYDEGEKLLNTWLELKADGTFHLSQGGETDYFGTYTVSGTTITLVLVVEGTAHNVTGTLEGSTITIPEMLPMIKD